MAASDVHLALRHSFAVTQRTFQRHMTELVRDGFLICLDPHKSSNHRFRRVGSTWPEFKRQRDAWMEANSQ